MSNINVQNIVKDVQKQYGDDILEKIVNHTVSDLDDNVIYYEEEGGDRADFFYESIDEFLDNVLAYYKVSLYDDLYENDPNVDDLHEAFVAHLKDRIAEEFKI